jgi:hypothetical protein
MVVRVGQRLSSGLEYDSMLGNTFTFQPKESDRLQASHDRISLEVIVHSGSYRRSSLL